MKHVVKRAGHGESFDSRKVYASVYAACLSVRETETTAELVAQQVSNEVGKWMTTKHEVTANDIRHQTAKILKKLNPHAGYLYLHHRVLW